MSTHRQSAGAWIPPSAPYAPLAVPVSPFAALESLPRAQWETLRVLPAAERRLYVPHFAAGFQILKHQVTFYGLCPECQQRDTD